jgi:subtilisin family serine protease
MKVLNVVLLVLFSSLASARVGSVQRVLGPVGSTIPDQFVVMLDEDVDARGLVNGLKNSGQAEILFEYSIIKGFAMRMHPVALQNAFKNIEGVTVYEDTIATAIEVQSAVESWGLDRVDQTTGLDNKYSYARNGTNVDAYILDTGIDIYHTEFEDRASYGWDFTDDIIRDGDPHGHGTHVAGTLH